VFTACEGEHVLVDLAQTPARLAGIPFPGIAATSDIIVLPWLLT
jgi:hypothetical protein